MATPLVRKSAEGRLPVIFGCASPTLGQAEKSFFREADPVGFILFRRNVAEPDQVRRLVADLRDTVGRADAPVLIDQEGGRVARLGPPNWPSLPPARAIGRLAERDPEAGLAAAGAISRAIAAMLTPLGIDTVCAPVVDLGLAETHAVIGDRAFSDDPRLVGRLAAAACSAFLDAGVTPIVKHVPGHGRARADSHLSLPRIETPRAILDETDFTAFRLVADAPWAMVAHCLYDDLDSDYPASVSPTVIAEIVRGAIGMDGVLIADDIGMQALSGSLAERARRTLAAGCDLTLHCSGELAEMGEIATDLPTLGVAAAARIVAACSRRAAVGLTDLAVEIEQLDRLLAA